MPSGNLDEAITSLTSNNPADDEGLVRVRRASIDDVFDIIRLPMTIVEWVNDLTDSPWLLFGAILRYLPEGDVPRFEPCPSGRGFCA